MKRGTVGILGCDVYEMARLDGGRAGVDFFLVNNFSAITQYKKERLNGSGYIDCLSPKKMDFCEEKIGK